MRIKEISMTAHPSGATLMVVVDARPADIAETVRKAAEDPEEKPYVLEIKKQKKARSLDANAYYWVLIEKLSQVLHISKDDLHLRMLRDYGSFKYDDEEKLVVFSLRADIDVELVPVYAKLIGKGNVNGTEFNHYAVLKGSHEMDSHEFSALLEGVIAECQEQGIQTITPLELARMEEALGYVNNPTDPSEPVEVETEEQMRM